MMSRRRALLIASLGSYLYDVSTIDSILLGEGTSANTFHSWYTCQQFETDTDAGVFIMTDPILQRLSYNTPTIFTSSICENYCMKDVTTGNVLYYFPNSCIYSLAHDETSGLYSITAHGHIKVLTPRTAS